MACTEWSYAAQTHNVLNDQTDRAYTDTDVAERRSETWELRRAAAATMNCELMGRVERTIWLANHTMTLRGVPLKLTDVRVPGAPLEE